jgi:hypothetical protein
MHNIVKRYAPLNIALQPRRVQNPSLNASTAMLLGFVFLGACGGLVKLVVMITNARCV